jgi:hypothetical protein
MAANREVWQRGFVAKRPRDPNQLAKLIVDIAIGEKNDEVAPKKRAASVRGRSGGLKGGKVRQRILRLPNALTLPTSLQMPATLADAAYVPEKRGPYNKGMEERCG